MKIIFENSIFLHQPVGGISKYISKINQIFQKKKINSIIYSPISINNNLDIKKNYNISYFKFKKIPRFCTKLFYLINNLATFFFINLYKPDLVHFSYYNNSLLRFINIPYVLTIYDLISEKSKHVEKKFQKEQLLQNASHIICNSSITKKDLIKFYDVDKNKVSVIYMGVEDNKKLIKKKKIIYYL